jgi:hypothetical protein
VFFDLLTIRFLLNYMSRPLHFFGVLGALSIMAGSSLSTILFAMKAISPQQDTMSIHGPMFVIAAVLILSGVQLLSIGLLGELQVRHYHSMESKTPYTIDRLVRLPSLEVQGSLSAEHDAGL